MSGYDADERRTNVLSHVLFANLYLRHSLLTALRIAFEYWYTPDTAGQLAALHLRALPEFPTTYETQR